MIERIIYKVTNLLNGKIYIGRLSGKNSKYLGSGIEINLSIKKYGRENFKREILEDCTGRNLEELNKREIFWIKKLDAINPLIGYNISLGGEGASNYHHTEENRKIMSEKRKGFIFIPFSIQKMSQSHMGMKWSEESKKKSSLKKKGKFCSLEHRNNISKSMVGKNAIPILQFDLEDNFIKEWPSITETNQTLHCDINGHLVGYQQTAGGFKWRYKDPILASQQKQYISKPWGISFLQYSLDGIFIQEFSSIKEATKFCEKNYGDLISDCCLGRKKLAYGFKWKYKK